MSAGVAGDLVLEAVTKSFGDVVAVDRVSLAVKPGEFYSLLGPSGCGKTTTLRLVAGFERPDGGRIVLAGTDVTTLAPNHRRVNTVFQHYALFPHLTVEENVAYGLRHENLGRTERNERLERGLATVRLKDLRGRYPRELSGGQQQRVALARALVKEPAVLLLDEPLAALDLKLRKAMQSELKKLQERVGITFVYVTHDQEEALTLSDRIAVMNEGHILQEGPPEDIYERPRSRFVADFIGDSNFFEGVVEGTEGPVTVRTTGGLLLRCARRADVAAGDVVSVAVRPEKVEPSAPGTHANRFDAVVVRRTYLGDLVDHIVSIGDGEGAIEVKVQRQNRPDDIAAAWRVGERVAVGWSEDSALVVTEEGGRVADEDSRRLVAESLGSTRT